MSVSGKTIPCSPRSPELSNLRTKARPADSSRSNQLNSDKRELATKGTKGIPSFLCLLWLIPFSWLLPHVHRRSQNHNQSRRRGSRLHCLPQGEVYSARRAERRRRG